LIDVPLSLLRQHRAMSRIHMIRHVSSCSRATKLRITLVCVLVLLCLAFSDCKSRSPELQPDGGVTLDRPLTSFSQEITSTTSALAVRPSSVFEIRVKIKNTSGLPWSSQGKYPVDLSYKWLANGAILPIEGYRTHLPIEVLPESAVFLKMTGTAPERGENLVLRITLVQEGVAWFTEEGARYLDIPVKLIH